MLRTEITIKGEPKEIAALVLGIQERQMVPMHIADEHDEASESSDEQVMERFRENIRQTVFDVMQSNQSCFESQS